MNKGLIVALEGLDATGKNSQVRRMKEYLESKGKKVKLYSFPQYETTVGKVIAKYLKGEFGDISQVPRELLCIAYATDRASMAKEIEFYLEMGYYILIDRYTYSNLFTAAKLPESEWDTFINWIEDMEFNNLGVLRPDYNFYLYIDAEVSIDRIKRRGKRDYQDGKEDIHENNFKLLFDTAKCYLEFAEKNDNWFIIDQMKNGNQSSINEVFEMIKEKLDHIISKHDRLN